MSKKFHGYFNNYNESGIITPGCGSSLGGVNFTTLIILILIVLQFNKKNKNADEYDDDYEHDNQLIDNGILFIIAIFFLACGCKGWFGNRGAVV